MAKQRDVLEQFQQVMNMRNDLLDFQNRCLRELLSYQALGSVDDITSALSDLAIYKQYGDLGEVGYSVILANKALEVLLSLPDDEGHCILGEIIKQAGDSVKQIEAAVTEDYLERQMGAEWMNQNFQEE